MSKQFLTSPEVATKQCKQCGEHLGLEKFNSKQARCKPCVAKLRTGEIRLSDAYGYKTDDAGHVKIREGMTNPKFFATEPKSTAHPKETIMTDDTTTTDVPSLEQMIANDIAMEESMDHELAPETQAELKKAYYAQGHGPKDEQGSTKKVKDMTPDERLEYTLNRAEHDRKHCDVHDVDIVGDMVSKAYAKRGNIRCKKCVNAESSAAKKAAREGQAS